ncbi:MAG: type I restriction endonuclease subunit R [Candidatus Micrarchaeia archaeon]
MPAYITENEIEQEALKIFASMGYEIVYGPDIAPAPDGVKPERESYSQVVLVGRLKAALKRINPGLSDGVLDEAVKKIQRSESQNLLKNNLAFHELLVNGMDLQVKEKGKTVSKKLWLFDFENPKNNDFAAINQFTIIEQNNNRRPDILVFVNGIPLVIIELKNLADEKADIWAAYNQIQTYKAQISSLFHFNELVMISDGGEARVGTITSPEEWFVKWKLMDGKTIDDPTIMPLEVMLRGMLKKEILLDYVRHFIIFESTHSGIIKKAAQYHQFRAVKKALESTITAAGSKGNGQGGVVWHTQGSGKSLSMVFYSGLLVLSEKLNNPTLVVLTDRNDLDGQLFDTFCACGSLLRQSPVQASSRNALKKLLSRPAGGIVFTTIQKFFPDEKGAAYPKLSDRKNIIVIADEAHRSQYGFITGFARHMRDALPNATFIGFTGTPVELSDRDTRAVFGDYVDIYSIERAVKDGATVPIYYESRLAKIELKGSELPKVDEEFEEVTEGEEVSKKEKLKSKWSRLEALVGSKKRIRQVAEDLLGHFDKRCEILDGKVLVVCMSRRICVDMYDEIVRLRPDWHNKDDDKGAVKVIMTGSATDKLEWQQHIRNKPRRKAIEDLFKDPKSQIKMVIVRDMWLTGTDIPCLHTIYIDKPMRGHGLMQAIARVNRVFRDKPGGLVVDYIGLAENLKTALSHYTKEDRSETAIDKEKAVAVMLEKYEIVKDMLHGVNYVQFLRAPLKEKYVVIQTIERLLSQKSGKEKFMKSVDRLSQAFALAYPHPQAMKIRDELAFFQAVKAQFVKYTVTSSGENPKMEMAIKQIVSKAISSDQVIDVFEVAGLKKPDISVLSEEFLEEVRNMPQKNIAIEVLRKLVNEEIKKRTKKNLVQSRHFSEMLEEAVRAYLNRNLDSAQVVEELIQLAKTIKSETNRGTDLGLTEDEIAFYDALETNDSAVKVLGDDTLKAIARELVKTVKNSVSIDWTLKQSVQAEMRVMVKRILRKYGYPPDKQQKATETVLEQTKLLSNAWLAE